VAGHGPQRRGEPIEALREAGVAPLLGRDEELELLLRRWQQAKNGEGLANAHNGSRR
jgi:hypothetical protein